MDSREELDDRDSVERPGKGRRTKALARLVLKALLLSNIMVLINIIIVSTLVTDEMMVRYFASLLTILEGAIGLVLGGLTVITSGPSMTKVGEKVLHGQPYSAKRARQSEGSARTFFFYSSILTLIGFIIGL